MTWCTIAPVGFPSVIQTFTIKPVCETLGIISILALRYPECKAVRPDTIVLPSTPPAIWKLLPAPAAAISAVLVVEIPFKYS